MKVKQYPERVQEAFLVEANVYIDKINKISTLQSSPVTLSEILEYEADIIFSKLQNENITGYYHHASRGFWNEVINKMNFVIFDLYYQLKGKEAYTTITVGEETYNI